MPFAQRTKNAYKTVDNNGLHHKRNVIKEYGCRAEEINQANSNCTLPVGLCTINLQALQQIFKTFGSDERTLSNGSQNPKKKNIAPG